MRYASENDRASELVLQVVSVQRVAHGTTSIWLRPGDEGRCIRATPGQFAHIAVEGVFLRRPISIADYDGEAIRIIVQEAGRGTRKLSALRPRERVNALVPLGRSFPMAKAEERLASGKELWFVAGGIGLAPLLFCASSLRKSTRAANAVKSFAGFRDRTRVFGLDELAACGEVNLVVGGLVTEELEAALSKSKPAMLFSCGPAPMLRSLQEICRRFDVRAYASLEERMGCGIGACLVCSCKVGTGGGFDYKRVCRDGPVFDLSEVILP